MKTKEIKGITLISLAVTIVVLLILAGISINTVIGDNGIIKKAQSSAELTKESEAKEFINEAYDYISNIKLRVKKDIKDYIQTLVEILKKENIGEKIFANYSKEILELQNAIENRELSIDILNSTLKQFGAINEWW